MLLWILLLSISSLSAQRCGKINEVWKRCSSRCEQTCDNQTPVCAKGCGPPSCQCSVGFFRDSKSGECLNKAQCAPPPHTCATTLCAAMTQCVDGPNGPNCVPIPTDPIPPPPTCVNVNCKYDEYCSDVEGLPKCLKLMTDPIPPRGPMCSIQSDCPPGLSCIDSGNGKECMPVHIDPVMPPLSCDNLKCPDGQYCVNGDKGPKCLKAPIDPIDTPRCPRKCRKGQKCVSDPLNGPMCKINDGCGPNEVFKQCSNACFEKACGEENLDMQCSFVCGAPKCQCAEGFMRETYTNSCVKPAKCPPPIERTTEASTTTVRSTTDSSIPCGDTTCHPAWTCISNSFCAAPHTIPPPDCGGQYCSSSETCETVRVSCTRQPCPTDRKQCVLLPGATSPPAPILPDSCGPHGMICPEGETCQVAMAGCARLPCPPPVYSCSGQTATAQPVTTTQSSGGYGPALPSSCSTVRCPIGQTCRMKEVRCIRSPCYPVPTCD